MRIKKPHAPPGTHIYYDMAIHDFDRAMSIGLSQDLMVDRLIVNIRVSMTKLGYSTITDERHHSVITELFEMNWGIGLEKGKI